MVKLFQWIKKLHKFRSKNGLSEWVGASLNEEGDSGEIRIAALASISGI